MHFFFFFFFTVLYRGIISLQVEVTNLDCAAIGPPPDLAQGVGPFWEGSSPCLPATQDLPPTPSGQPLS